MIKKCLGVVALTTLLTSTPINAAPPVGGFPPWEQQIESVYRQSAFVFVAKVTDLTASKTPSGEIQRAVIEPARVLKGGGHSLPKQIFNQILIPPPTEYFRTHIRLGETYLFFLASPEGNPVEVVSSPGPTFDEAIKVVERLSSPERSNPSIERTSPGKPGAASHVKR